VKTLSSSLEKFVVVKGALYEEEEEEEDYASLQEVRHYL
jgi:hypothetical protein